MITYLAVTSVLNMAIGYALAMYLGHARPQPAAIAPVPTTPAAAPPSPPTPTPMPLATTPTAAPLAEAPPAEAPAAQDKGWAEAFLKNEAGAAAVEALQPVMEPSVVLPPAEEVPTAYAELPSEEEEPAAGESEARSPEVEQELLAGIEEFRNQLAQLKSGAPEGQLAAAPAG